MSIVALFSAIWSEIFIRLFSPIADFTGTIVPEPDILCVWDVPDRLLLPRISAFVTLCAS